jgi:hypothetical protein
MMFHNRLQQRMIVRGPDCGCGGTCSFCAPMLGRLHAGHAQEIAEATRHLDTSKPAPPEKTEADSEK